MNDWEVIMSFDRLDAYGNVTRSRFFSPHSLAAITGRTDLLQLVAEMKESGKVFAGFCNTVKAPVFFLRQRYGHIYGDELPAWNMVEEFIKQNPYPQVKGFKKAETRWTGGEYGKGQCIIDNAITEPFIEEDYDYANGIIKALKKAGFKPALEPYKTEKVSLYRAD